MKQPPFGPRNFYFLWEPLQSKRVEFEVPVGPVGDGKRQIPGGVTQRGT